MRDEDRCPYCGRDCRAGYVMWRNKPHHLQCIRAAQIEAIEQEDAAEEARIGGQFGHGA